jgi:hypothetical protein
MTLQDWDTKVRPHLNFIRSGAEMAARHARQLPLRPAFESKAEDELAEARAVLEAALKQIVTAQATYASKPLESAS